MLRLEPRDRGRTPLVVAPRTTWQLVCQGRDRLVLVLVGEAPVAQVEIAIVIIRNSHIRVSAVHDPTALTLLYLPRRVVRSPLEDVRYSPDRLVRLALKPEALERR